MTSACPEKIRKERRAHRGGTEYTKVFLVFQYVTFVYFALSLRSPRPSLLFPDEYEYSFQVLTYSGDLQLIMSFLFILPAILYSL